ncbi:reticulon-4-interacting protein 1, mitochondrial precursor [Daldinia decipiens]|uniref:reticulon-4-interacting protein 1, mitochondrial precursor n=1 Tax=Daldinia decipiens TaxID=326647 RepID=UPI0020C1C9F2|nr:reticulon-4-interacting protein 1, mitochondrial precursor [Daldinia decipiens]KAI1655331.1 reticulon-4-interacting protein 1, mitochondrial precursor [Daldinia decipiens]
MSITNNSNNTTSPATPKTMRAWVYTSTRGGIEKNIHLISDAPLPFLPKDAILVKVHYSSLNPADYKFPELGLPMRALIPTPASPGMDFSGVVAQVGDSVDALRAGDAVFGRIPPTKHGSLGEYVCARLDGCAAVPAGVSLQDASCIGTAAQTAYQCIAPNVSPGDKVFVNGGSGGTGTFGIQIAKALGCHVTASCSGKNADLCRSLGADEVVDYTAEDVSQVLKAKGQVYQLVVDNVGTPADLHKAADHFLRPDGKFVQIGGEFTMANITTVMSRGLLPSFLGGGKRKWQYLVTSNTHADLEQIAKWMSEGKVKAIIDEVFQYEDAPKAFEKLRTGRAKGKIVIKSTA